MRLLHSLASDLPKKKISKSPHLKNVLFHLIISGLVVGLILKLLDHFIFKHHANILLNNIPDVVLQMKEAFKKLGKNW